MRTMCCTFAMRKENAKEVRGSVEGKRMGQKKSDRLGSPFDVTVWGYFPTRG